MIPNLFEAKLLLRSKTEEPDVFDSSYSSPPSENFVISRDRNGSTVSRYADFTWDISSWQTEGRRTVLSFSFWKKMPMTMARESISAHARWLMFSLIWLREGRPLTSGTLGNYMSTIRALAIYSEKNDIGIMELLGDEQRLIHFAERACLAGRLKSLCGLLNNLESIGEELLGFGIVGERTQREIQERARVENSDTKQTPPIPTRVYMTVIDELINELAEWEKVAAECLIIIRDCHANPAHGRRFLSQKAPVQTLSWADVASLELRSYLSQRGQEDSVSGLASMVTQVQLVAKLTIQAFSGMRDDEAQSLPYNCMFATELGGKVQRFIQGRTTKLSRGPKSARWVTNREGHRAVEVAQKIAAVIYSENGVPVGHELQSSNEKEGRPLLVSLAYLSLGGRRRSSPPDGFFVSGSLNFARFARLRKRLQPTIEDADIKELEQIDEHRSWRSEECFRVGSAWPLETHQLRRSLALYAQRSGLVTLTSLRRQLQHITEDMTRYYTRGSQYAIDIFNTEPLAAGHFCFDWQSAQAESASLSYAAHVLFTDEKLFGGHATFIHHRLEKDSATVTTELRAQTKKMFLSGQLHYQETLLGGCTRRENQCEATAVDWLSLSCIATNCSNLVGNFGKLELVIEEQQRHLSSLPPLSLLYRSESANLELLMNARDKAQREQDTKTI